MTLPDETLTAISRAEPSQWHDIGEAASEQGWTADDVKEKVREIKANPERIDEILSYPAPQHREFQEPQPPDLQELVYAINGYFADIAEMRIKHQLTSEMIKKHAADIYTWHDAVSERLRLLRLLTTGQVECITS